MFLCIWLVLREGGRQRQEKEPDKDGFYKSKHRPDVSGFSGK